MAIKVNKNPGIPTGATNSIPKISVYLLLLVRMLSSYLGSLAVRANIGLARDGTEAMTGPLVTKSYTVAGVPAASDYTQGVIYVSDETGGATLAFSDGTNWRRVQDRVIIS